jgi:thiamine-monophosphate kinase
MNEFDIIQQFFHRPAKPEWLALGIGDDGAVIEPSPAQQVIVTDTLLEGRHFFAGTDARAIAHKALAVNLSDLAAMGAKPRWFTLNLTLPKVDKNWLAAFSEGLFRLADEHGVCLIGGDTTRGPLSISITAAGELPTGRPAFLRGGAQVGGRLGIVGGLGLAAMAVAAREAGNQASAAASQALDFPQPQLAAGLRLHGIATAACDVSDGLLADLGHIAQASSLGFDLDGEALAALAVEQDSQAAKLLFAGGDDYALLFVTSAGIAVPDWANDIGVAVAAREPNAIQLNGGPSWLQAGFAEALDKPGFQHF